MAGLVAGVVKGDHAAHRKVLVAHIFRGEERVARQDFSERQNFLITASIERMNERITSLESRRTEERAEMMIVLRGLQESTEHLSTAIERVISTHPPQP